MYRARFTFAQQLFFRFLFLRRFRLSREQHGAKPGIEQSRNEIHLIAVE
jgi:hypothetical protein